MRVKSLAAGIHTARVERGMLPEVAFASGGALVSKTIGPYSLLEPLGSGGMGVVYRARDSRLGRDVALKLLPPDVFSDPRARARLVQEARLASALNHPHICTIYEVGEAGGETYIAMEQVEGRSLAECIPPGGMHLEAVLRYGAQLADALAHAHARGIVHRDLKTSNVILTPDGRAKVLDFGIAKRIGTHPEDSTLEWQPSLTEAGSILGTPGYLAPEVLQGEGVGPRSDIWALGILIYEMATGGRPFAGRTPAELVAAILTKPAAPLPAELPAGFRALVQRCLEKEPGLRVQQASEVRLALETLHTDVRVAPPARAAAPKISRDSRRVILWAGAIAALLGIIALAIVKRPHVATHHPLEQRQLTSNPANDPVAYASISPDGNHLAIVELTGVSVRQLDSGDTRKIEFPQGFVITSPCPRADWYPDGSALLLSGGQVPGESFPSIWSAPLVEGKPRRLVNDGFGAALSPDASKIAYVHGGADGEEIWLMGAHGEDPHQLVPGDATGVMPMPAWSPVGTRIVYGRGVVEPTGAHVEIETCDLSGGRRPVFGGSSGQYLAAFASLLWLHEGRLVFAQTDLAPNQTNVNLWSIFVNPRSGAVSGKPSRITEWPRASLLWPTAVTADGKQMSVEFIRWQSDCYLGRLASGDSLLQDVERLTTDDRMDMEPAWISDGKSLLFTSDRNGTYDIFRQSLDSHEVEALVSGPGSQSGARVSPDGKWILYRDTNGAQESGKGRLMRMPLGGGPAEVVLEMKPTGDFQCGSTPDAISVLVEMDGSATVFTAFDPLKGRGRALTRIDPSGFTPWSLAPDGRTIAVVEGKNPRVRIHLLSLTGAAARDVPIERDLTIVAHIAWDGLTGGWILTGASGDMWNLFHVDPGGKATPLLSPQKWMYSSAIAPDGVHIAYTSNTIEGNAWLLTHF